MSNNDDDFQIIEYEYIDGIEVWKLEWQATRGDAVAYALARELDIGEKENGIDPHNQNQWYRLESFIVNCPYNDENIAVLHNFYKSLDWNFEPIEKGFLKP